MKTLQVGDAKALREAVWPIVAPVAESLGLTLIEVELAQEYGRQILRCYIDKEEGVSVDDCADLSREASLLLDVEEVDGLLRGGYNFEVSSPGEKRPLRRVEDFLKYVGERIEIKTLGEGRRRKAKGILLACDEDGITLEQNGEAKVYAHRDLLSAKLSTGWPGVISDDA